MASSKGPTSRQIALLRKFKIKDIPTTKLACSTLIDYVLNGRYSILTKPVDRARFVKKWSGARVRVVSGRSEYSGQTGEVIRVRMRSPQEIAELTEAHLGSPPIPFVLIVCLDSNGEQATIPTSALRITNDRRQETLFPLGAETGSL